MSKQSEAKNIQNYETNPFQWICMNCEHYLSDMVKGTTHTKEKNKRCGIGGFAVKKTASCYYFEVKEGVSDFIVTVKAL